ncbi:MAG: hypothetical protein SGJ05_03945 [bacterium]|nr:hypothetical protein [bacterium]
MAKTVASALLALIAIAESVSTRASDYGDVFGRWDLGLDFHMQTLSENTEFSKSNRTFLGYSVAAGLNIPVFYSDSLPWTIGINPSVMIGTVLESGLSIAVPVLATIKYNTDAYIRPRGGFAFGFAAGAGITWNHIIVPDDIESSLSDVIPTVMLELNFGRRKSGFPGLIKIRLTKPLGEPVHNNGTFSYTTTHLSLLYTTGF